MDAYLSDAYVSLLVATLSAFREGSVAALPSGLHKETLPIGPLLARRYPARANWGLRMAARSRMDRENMLQITRVKEMFNPFLPAGEKLWNDLIASYAALGRKRLTLWTAAELAEVHGERLAGRRKESIATLLRRIGGIVQRRHDIVHNCDRPKVAIQAMSLGQGRGMVADVRDFVRILDSHLTTHRIA